MLTLLARLDECEWEFALKSPKTRCTWRLLNVIVLSLLFATGCPEERTPDEGHGFSNLVLDEGTLYFGAGYKLYRVELGQPGATLLYDTNDVLISFVQVDERKLFFGGHHSPAPRGGTGMVWSLDLDSVRIVWKQEVRDDWGWRGRIVVPPLINDEMLILGTRTALYGIGKMAGDVRWKVEKNCFGGGELLSPILSNGQLYYGIADGFFGGNESTSNRTVAVADPASGKTLRTILMPGKLGAIPAVVGDRLFVKDRQYYRSDRSGKPYWVGELRLNCIDLSSGMTRWSFQGNGVPASSQIRFYESLILDVFANRLYAIEEQSGVLRWRSPALEAAVQNPQVIEELGVIALEVSGHRKVIFLDSLTGEPRDESLRAVLSHPVFIGREAIYGTTSAVTRVDAGTGDVIWTIPVDSRYQFYVDD
jgi:outer membrane protein assembly factor BamB